MVDILIVRYNKRRYDVLITDLETKETETHKFDSKKRADEFVENDVKEQTVVDSINYQFI